MVLIINIIITLVCFLWTTSVLYSLKEKECRGYGSRYNGETLINYPIYLHHFIIILIVSLIPYVNIITSFIFTMVIILTGKKEDDISDYYDPIVIADKTIAGKVMLWIKKLFTKQLN